MIARLVLGAILVLALPLAVSADDVPKELKAKAEKAYADGKSLFIWTVEKEPVQGLDSPMGSLSLFTVHFAVSPKQRPVAFRLKTELEVIDPDKKQATTFTTTADGNKEQKVAGKELSAAMAQGKQLRGNGVIKVYLVSGDNEKAAISNVLVLKAEFK